MPREGRPILRGTRSVIVLSTVMAVVALATATAATASQPDRPAEGDTALPEAITAIITKPKFQHASWGLLDRNARTGRAAHARRAQELFVPGSTTKLFSVSGAWKLLGPDSRITTPVYAQGTRRGSRLEGDLVLVGAGDVTFGGRTTPDGRVAFTDVDHIDANLLPGATLTPQNPLAGINALAEQVRAAGITRVGGDVVVDDRLFSTNLLIAPTPLMINENVIDVLVRPGAVGQPAALTVRPLAASYTVQSTVTTVRAGQPSEVTVSGSAPGQITVSGTIAADAPPLLRTADIDDPAAFGRTVFIQALRARGVQVDATATGPNPVDRLPQDTQYPAGSRVAQFESPRFAEQAKFILKVSHNLGANTTVCLLAVRAGSDDCADGFTALRAFLTRAGVDVESLVLSDGAGVDPNRLPPVAVTQLLRWWTRQPDFDRWRESLPILGVDGTLHNVATDSPARGKVFAKTGTKIDVDLLTGTVVLQTKALAGYFRTSDGTWQVFDIVVNNAGKSADAVSLFGVGEDVGQVAAALWEEQNR